MDPTTLIFIFFLIILSSFFSGAETALVSLSPAQVRTMVKNKRFASKTVELLKSNPNKLLITILIGNNVINILIGMYSALWATEQFGSSSLGIVTGVLTLLLLVFGEILPKTVAQKNSATFASVVAKPLQFLGFILYPLVYLLEFVIKIFGGNRGLISITNEELKAMVDIGAEEGSINIEKKELISNVLDFGETTVEQVMTDNSKIISMPSTINLKKAVDYFVSNEFSRLPIYNGDNKDDIIGILTIKDILRHKRNRDENLSLKNLDFIQPMFIPETKNISDLFKEFQWKRLHMAIVIDEFGKVSGLVTLEDILEEVFGEINDESDEDENSIQKLNNISWRVAGDVEIDKVNSTLGAKFSSIEHKTIAYFILNLLQKIPEKGDHVNSKGFEFFVEKMVGNRIDSIRVQKMVDHSHEEKVATKKKSARKK